jgi:hypothetical protein
MGMAISASRAKLKKFYLCAGAQKAAIRNRHKEKRL